MKISADTIQILKNFAMINSNMLVRQGSTLSTLSAASSIFAKAEVVETFPQEFAVYELNDLLQLLTFSDDQEVTFNEKSLSIQNDVGQFEFFYCEPNLVKAPPTKELDSDEVFQFSLTGKEVQTILKTSGLLSAPTISIIAKDGKVMLKIGDKKVAAMNSFKKVIGEFEGEFECNIATENFKLLPDAYDVVIDKKMFCKFTSQSRKLSYMIAVEPGSTI